MMCVMRMRMDMKLEAPRLEQQMAKQQKLQENKQKPIDFTAFQKIVLYDQGRGKVDRIQLA